MDYYLIRAWIQIITIIFYTILFHSNLIIQYRIFKLLNYSTIIIMIILFILYILNITIKDIIKVNLTLNGSIFSLTFFIITLNYIYKITNKYDYSIFISILSVTSLGWLYEIPFNHNIYMFYNPSFSINSILYYPLFLQSQLLSLILMIISMIKNKCKITKLTIIFILFYTIYFVYMFIYSSDNGNDWFLYLYNKHLARWLIRLPSALLILSLFSGFKKE